MRHLPNRDALVTFVASSYWTWRITQERVAAGRLVLIDGLVLLFRVP